MLMITLRIDFLNALKDFERFCVTFKLQKADGQ